MTDPTPPQSGEFLETIKAAAEREVNAILADALGRTAEVERVLAALNLPLPEALRTLHGLLGVVPTAPPVADVPPPATEQAAPSPPPPPAPAPPRTTPVTETAVAKVARERDDVEHAVREAMRERSGQQVRVADILGPVNVLATQSVVKPPDVKQMLEFLAKKEWLKKGGPVGDTFYTYTGEGASRPIPPPPAPPAAPPPKPVESKPSKPKSSTAKFPKRPPPKRGEPHEVDVEGGKLTWQPHLGRWAYTQSPEYKPLVAAKERNIKTFYDFLQKPENAKLSWTVGEMKHLYPGSSKAVAEKVMNAAVERKFVRPAERRLGRTSPPKTRHSQAYRLVPGVPFSSMSKIEGWEKYPRPSEIKAPEEETPPGPPEAPPEAAAPPTQQELVDLLRDVMKKHAGEQSSVSAVQYDMNQARPGLHISTDRVTRLLDMLVDSGIIQAFNDGAFRRYRYDRPTEPGRAAEIDAQRRRTHAGNGGAADPVPGTGRGVRAATGIANNILASARRILGDDKVTATSGNHWLLALPDGSQVLVSNGGVAMRDKAKLRKLNIAVP